MGLDLIKKFEGLELDAYLCPAGVWTIGYGHTETVKPGYTITKKKAEKLLERDLIKYEKAVRLLLQVSLNENQFSALVCFVYNVGIGAFSKSTMLRKINEGKTKEASKEFMRWIYANRKILKGLVLRRKAERALFDKV